MPLWHLDRVLDTRGGGHDSSTPAHAEDLRLGNFSERTVRHHTHTVAEFAKYFRNPRISLVQTMCAPTCCFWSNDRKLAWGTIQRARSALKFLYTRTGEMRQCLVVSKEKTRNHFLNGCGSMVTIPDRACRSSPCHDLRAPPAERVQLET